jgi:hypothetical protein
MRKPSLPILGLFLLSAAGCFNRDKRPVSAITEMALITPHENNAYCIVEADHKKDTLVVQFLGNKQPSEKHPGDTSNAIINVNKTAKGVKLEFQAAKARYISEGYFTNSLQMSEVIDNLTLNDGSESVSDMRIKISTIKEFAIQNPGADKTKPTTIFRAFQ